MKFVVGEKVKVKKGPYYKTSDGVKIKFGCSGVGVVESVLEDGLLIKFEGESSSRYVYTGPEKVSPLTGTILSPHKISKKRK